MNDRRCFMLASLAAAVLGATATTATTADAETIDDLRFEPVQVISNQWPSRYNQWFLVQADLNNRGDVAATWRAASQAHGILFTDNELTILDETMEELPGYWTGYHFEFVELQRIDDDRRVAGELSLLDERGSWAGRFPFVLEDGVLHQGQDLPPEPKVEPSPEMVAAFNAAAPASSPDRIRANTNGVGVLHAGEDGWLYYQDGEVRNLRDMVLGAEAYADYEFLSLYELNEQGQILGAYWRSAFDTVLVRLDPVFIPTPAACGMGMALLGAGLMRRTAARRHG